MVVQIMVWHFVEEVCTDEAVQISGGEKYDTMFWCMVLRVSFSAPFGEFGVKIN